MDAVNLNNQTVKENGVLMDGNIAEVAITDNNNASSSPDQTVDDSADSSSIETSGRTQYEIMDSSCKNVDETRDLTDTNTLERTVIAPSYSAQLPLADASSKEIEERALHHHCCYHVCRPSGPPPDDGKCCLHRCRPKWTIEQRAKNHNEDINLLSQLYSCCSTSHGHTN